ncbi:hypothetical protein HK103_001945 [Boothiomyces macroporosus]|uniref:MAGE domain-containing protein n=1 Tax=Boothiomyces macroporosus TaxID=261099 RepID=A0AAD5UNM1_9FUNG|nr:hypothetical protein HK103_001945 [Boothiomyces macroporosus]
MMKFGVDIDGHSDIFGSMPEIIAYYVKHMYLDKFKEQGDDEFTYTWGPRAKALFPEKNLMKLMAQMYPDMDENKTKVLMRGIKMAAEE